MILKEHDVLYFNVQDASNVIDEKVEKERKRKCSEIEFVYFHLCIFFNVIE